MNGSVETSAATQETPALDASEGTAAIATVTDEAPVSEAPEKGDPEACAQEAEGEAVSADGQVAETESAMIVEETVVGSKETGDVTAQQEVAQATPEDQGAVSTVPVEEERTGKIIALWELYVKSEEMDSTDRLLLASKYREWAKGIEECLKPAPAFADVWSRREKRTEVAETLPMARSGSDNWHSFEEALLSIQNEHRSTPFNASLISDRMRQRRGRLSFGSLTELLRRAERSGWLSLSRERDNVFVRWLRMPHGSGKQAESPVADQAGDKSNHSPMREHWESRANKEASRRGRYDGRASDEELRKSLDRRGKPLSERRKPNLFSESECINMLDEALKDVCQRGLYRELPMNASVLSDRLRRMFPKFLLRLTPFQRFGELLRCAEREGLVKVARRRDEVLLTWVKHRYQVLPQVSRSPERRRVSRNRRARSRSRSGRPGRRERCERPATRRRSRRNSRRSLSASSSYSYSDFEGSSSSRSSSVRRRPTRRRR